MSSVLLQILGLIQSSINNNNSTNVRKLLQKLPLEDMEDSEIHKILIFCLNFATYIRLTIKLNSEPIRVNIKYI